MCSMIGGGDSDALVIVVGALELEGDKSWFSFNVNFLFEMSFSVYFNIS